MGIDREGPVVKSESYNNDGAADVVSLVIFDDTNKNFSVLMLNRDTMTEMQVLGIGGRPADTVTAQLALAHTYGSGMEDSCENVKDAVSQLLGGIEIDYYMSMNMDAISILNDKVGGVTVTVTDDFSKVDDTIPKGEIKLKGDQALSFVRNRQDVGDQLNVSRMERQKEYMYGFMDAVKAKAESDGNTTTEIYNSIKPYIVSDCSVSNFTNIINRCSDYTLKEIVTPEGENVKGEQYMEYHLDEEAAEDLALRLFYSEKPTID
ncbi:MAG: LCP family protein [Clostridia bacterium]|nr:LCP family protein [Clostridia bacterium]